MMSKSLNYDYPQKYAFGGLARGINRSLGIKKKNDDDVDLDAFGGAGPEPETPTASGSGSGSGLARGINRALARSPNRKKKNDDDVDLDAFGGAAPDTPVFSLPPGVDPMYPAPPPPEPETPTYQSSDAAPVSWLSPPEQKSTSYAFVDADGNSYNMGDARPGHDGTSLERAIANVQEYYDFAPGSFTVSVPSEERLVGTYDSDSGSFQAATSDMRDLNGFSALPGEGLMPDPPRPPNPFLDLEVMPDFIDPMIPEGPGYTPPTDIPFTDIPPVVVPPNTGYTFPVAPDAGSFLDFYNNQPPVYLPPFQRPTQGRTYGAGSGTPMGPTNSIQPFTPYMPPQQAQGADLQSLITDTDYFLNNSAPRTSVFKRS